MSQLFGYGSFPPQTLGAVICKLPTIIRVGAYFQVRRSLLLRIATAMSHELLIIALDTYLDTSVIILDGPCLQ